MNKKIVTIVYAYDTTAMYISSKKAIEWLSKTPPVIRILRELEGLKTTLEIRERMVDLNWLYEYPGEKGYRLPGDLKKIKFKE